MSYHEYMKAQINLTRDACSSFWATITMGEQYEGEGALFSAEMDGQISCRIRTAAGSAELVRLVPGPEAGGCAAAEREIAGMDAA